MPKESEHVKSVKIGERKFLDMSSIKRKKGVTLNEKRR